MNNLKEYIIEKFKISKDINTSSSLEKIKDRDDAITKDFRKLYKIIVDEFGKEAEPIDSLVAMSDFDDDYTEFYYEFDERKWYRFLRDVVNYDWICLGKNGGISIENSNHKDIAKIIKKWNRLDIGKEVYNSFR